MIIQSQTVFKIVPPGTRSYLLIENLTDSSLYLSKIEDSEVESYTNRGVVLKLNGLLELNPCVYQGGFWGVCDIDSDIRVLEL